MINNIDAGEFDGFGILEYEMNNNKMTFDILGDLVISPNTLFAENKYEGGFEFLGDLIISPTPRPQMLNNEIFNEKKKIL